MGLAAAGGQLLLCAALLLGGGAFVRHHLAGLQRADHSGSPYMEDAKAGNGTRYRVLQRAADTGGDSYTVEVLARGTAPGFVEGYAASLPAHAHLVQDEEVVVRSGRLGYTRGGAFRDGGELGPGETLSIPKGTPHTFYNADNATSLLYELTHRPAGPMGERFFESLAGLGWTYTSLDRIHPLQVLVLYEASATRLADFPGFMAPVVSHVLVPAARLLGFEPDYPSYRSARQGGGSTAPAPAADAAAEEASDEEAVGEAPGGKEEL